MPTKEELKAQIIEEAKRLRAKKNSMLTDILLDAQTEEQQDEAIMHLYRQAKVAFTTFTIRTSEKFADLILNYVE